MTDPHKLRESLSVERTLADMEAAGIEPTRENLIHKTTGGRPQEWGIEDEAELPDHLQDWEAFRAGPYNHND